MSAAVEVEIFVDASCPYCHYGLATIRRLFDELAADPERARRSSRRGGSSGSTTSSRPRA